MDFFSKLSLPFTDPVIIFLIVFSVVFIAPRLLKYLRIPGIVGFIVAGVLLGPHGFNIIAPDKGFNLLSTFGLLYIMFLVGLEMNYIDFRKKSGQGIVFGSLTFLVPMLIGILTSLFLLGNSLPASLLVGCMLATHTLVSYPVINRLGLIRHPIVTTAISGTIITDTAVLLMLAVITHLNQGGNGILGIVHMLVLLSVYIVIILWLIPLISAWFLKKLEGEGSSQFIYLMAVLFLSAFLSKVAGVEPIIGAFFAGLSLNRLIPASSVLMNRTVFTGNTIFIPFFLLGVGMIVNPKVLLNGTTAAIFAGILVIVSIFSKFFAAFITQKLFKFSLIERNVLFGLSSSHAAATIAVVMVGYNLGILNINMLNGTVLVILFSCIVSSLVTEHWGRKLAIRNLELTDNETYSNERTLLAIANPATISQILSLSLLLKKKDKNEILYALSIIIGNLNSDNLEQEIIQKRTELNQVAGQLSCPDNEFRFVSRIDVNAANGINRAIKELTITKVIMGWNGKVATIGSFFDSILNNVLQKNHQMILVIKILHSFSDFRRIRVFLPDNICFESGFLKSIKEVFCLSSELSANTIFHVKNGSEGNLKALTSHSQLKNSKLLFYNHMDELSDTDLFNPHHELMVFFNVRQGSVAYENKLASLPRLLSQYYEHFSFIVLYPEQYPSDDHHTSISLIGTSQNTPSLNQNIMEKAAMVFKKQKK